MKRFIFGAAILGLLLGPVGHANAALISITNAGFEAFTLNNGEWVYDIPCPVPVNPPEFSCTTNSNPIPGWTATGDAGTFNPTTTNYPGEALNVAFSNGPSISQVLAAVLTLGTTLTLQVDVGNRLDTPFPGYAVQLLAGGTLLAQENSLSPLSGTFATSLLTYTPFAGDPFGSPLEIRLMSAGLQADFDNVRLDAGAPVPEPGTLVLLGTGFVGMGTIVRRRSRRDGK